MIRPLSVVRCYLNFDFRTLTFNKSAIGKLYYATTRKISNSRMALFSDAQL